MSTQPTVYDATNLSQDDIGMMAGVLAQGMQNGEKFDLKGPQSSDVMTAAQSILAGKGAILPSAWPQASGSSPLNPAPNVAGSNAVGAGGDESGSNLNFGNEDAGAAQREQKALDNASPSFISWLGDHAGNWGLVVLGVLLAIGALLISQRQTIVQVGKEAAKVAAVAA